MANENIGEMIWDCCDENQNNLVFVRMDKKHKLYLACPHCGIFGAKGQSFQRKIKDNATMYGEPTTGYQGGGIPAEPRENPEGQQTVAPEAKPEKPETIPTKEPKKASFLARLLSED